MSNTLSINEICAAAPVVPVLTIPDIDSAVPLARALIAGGLRVLEITLRSDVALQAIDAITAACPEAIVGAGSLRRPADLDAVWAAGAVFGVSPGAPRALIDAVQEGEFAFLPGCATATEAMELSDRGFEILKLFPAEQVGGVATLKAWKGPLPGLRFCPTGGVTPESAPSYLGLPNVACVGGSWVAPVKAIAAGEWDTITRLASEAMALGRTA